MSVDSPTRKRANNYLQNGKSNFAFFPKSLEEGYHEYLRKKKEKTDGLLPQKSKLDNYGYMLNNLEKADIFQRYSKLLNWDEKKNLTLNKNFYLRQA